MEKKNTFVGMNHGVDCTNPHFLSWVIGLPLIYFLLLSWFRKKDWWDFKTRRGSRASDIMAFEIVAGFSCAYLAVSGLVGSYGLLGAPNELERLDQLNDIYARSEFVQNFLIYPMITFQGWNALLCLFVSDLRDPAMIGHHIVSASVAYFGLHPFGHRSALFYFGIAEFTNIPLTIVDVFKYFPELAKQFRLVNEASRYIFALSFVVLRLIIWPIGAVSFWWTCTSLLREGTAHSTFVVSLFLGANLFLTALQFWWGSKIFGFLLRTKKATAKE